MVTASESMWNTKSTESTRQTSMYKLGHVRSRQGTKVAHALCVHTSVFGGLESIHLGEGSNFLGEGSTLLVSDETRTLPALLAHTPLSKNTAVRSSPPSQAGRTHRATTLIKISDLPLPLGPYSSTTSPRPTPFSLPGPPPPPLPPPPNTFSVICQRAGLVLYWCYCGLCLGFGVYTLPAARGAGCRV